LYSLLLQNMTPSLHSIKIPPILALFSHIFLYFLHIFHFLLLIPCWCSIHRAHYSFFPFFISYIQCLRKILRIFWPDQITNEELWKRTKQLRIDLQIRKRKWGWLGHKLRQPCDNIARQALEWNPQGKRRRGRLGNTWQRIVLEEAKRVKKTWMEIKTDAKNRVRWRILVEVLCSAAEWWDVIYISYIHNYLCIS